MQYCLLRLHAKRVIENTEDGPEPGKDEKIMLELRSKGGETVKGGTYWNSDTGEKLRIEANGVLPVKLSQSFLKFPPAIVPTIGLIVIGVLPGYLSGLYSAYTERLVEAYVIFGLLTIFIVCAGLSVMVYRDWSALSRSITVFSYRPIVPLPLKISKVILVPITAWKNRNK